MAASFNGPGSDGPTILPHLNLPLQKKPLTAFGRHFILQIVKNSFSSPFGQISDQMNFCLRLLKKILRYSMTLNGPDRPGPLFINFTRICVASIKQAFTHSKS